LKISLIDCFWERVRLTIGSVFLMYIWAAWVPSFSGVAAQAPTAHVKPDTITITADNIVTRI
jgi:hypothetical protein